MNLVCVVRIVHEGQEENVKKKGTEIERYASPSRDQTSAPNSSFICMCDAFFFVSQKSIMNDEGP